MGPGSLKFKLCDERVLIFVGRKPCGYRKENSQLSLSIGRKIDAGRTFNGEFDSGSERTLAAWIRHASRTLDCV